MKLLVRNNIGQTKILTLNDQQLNGICIMLYLIEEATILLSPPVELFQINSNDYVFIATIKFDYYKYINSRTNPTFIELFKGIPFNPQIHSWDQFLTKNHLQSKIINQYVALLYWADLSVLVQFNDLSFVDGVIEVCNWFNQQWSAHILFVAKRINNSYLPIDIVTEKLTQQLQFLSL